MKKILFSLALLIAFYGPAQGHIVQNQLYRACLAAIVFSFEASFVLGSRTGLRGVDEVSQGKIDNDKADFIDKLQQSEPRRTGADSMDETETSGIITPISEEEITSFKIVINEVIGECDSTCSTETVVPTAAEFYIERHTPLNETMVALMDMFMDEDEEVFDDIRLLLFEIDGENICEMENRLCNEERKKGVIEQIVQEFLKEMKEIEGLGTEPDDEILDERVAHTLHLTEDRLDELMETNLTAKRIIDETFFKLEYNFLDEDLRQKYGVGINGITTQLKGLADDGFVELDDAVAQLNMTDDNFSEYQMILKESEREDLEAYFESQRAKLQIPKKDLEEQIEKGYIAHGYTKAENGTFIPPINGTTPLQSIVEDESDPSGRRLLFIRHPDHKSLDDKLEEIREEHRAQEPRRRLETSYYKEKATKLRELKRKVPGHSFELQMKLRKLADDCEEGTSGTMCDSEKLSSSALNLGSITEELASYTTPVADIFESIGNFGDRLPTIFSLATIINTVLLAAGAIPYVGIVFKLIQNITTKALKVLEKIKNGFNTYKKRNGDKFEKLFENVDNILNKVNQGTSAVGTIGAMGYGVAIIKENQCIEDLATIFLGDATLDTISNAVDSVLSYVNMFMQQANGLLNAFRSSTWQTVKSILDKAMNFVTPLEDILTPLKPLEDLMKKKITLPYFKLPYAEKYIGQAICDSNYYRGNVLRTQCFEKTSDKWEEKSGLSLDTVAPPWKMTVKCSYKKYKQVNSLFGKLRSKRCYTKHYETHIRSRQFRWRGWTPTYFCPGGYSGYRGRCAKNCNHGFSRDGKWCYKNSCYSEYNKNGKTQCIPREKYQNVRNARCNHLNYKLEEGSSMAVWLDGSCRQSCSSGVKKFLGVCFPEASIDVSLGDIVNIFADALKWLADKAAAILDAIIDGIKRLAGPILKPITDIIDGIKQSIEDMLEAVGMPDLSQISIDILPFSPSELMGGLPEIPNIEDKIDTVKDFALDVIDKIPIPQEFKDCGFNTACLVDKVTEIMGVGNITGIVDDIKGFFEENAIALESIMDLSSMIECSSWDEINIPMSNLLGMLDGYVPEEISSADLPSCDIKIPRCKEYNSEGIKDIIGDVTSGMSQIIEKFGNYFESAQDDRKLHSCNIANSIPFLNKKLTDWNSAVFLPVIPISTQSFLVDYGILRIIQDQDEEGKTVANKEQYDMNRWRVRVPWKVATELGILVEPNQIEGNKVGNVCGFFSKLFTGQRNWKFAINPVLEIDLQFSRQSGVDVIMQEITNFFDNSWSYTEWKPKSLDKRNGDWLSFAPPNKYVDLFYTSVSQKKVTLKCDNGLIDELWYYTDGAGKQHLIDGLREEFVLACIREGTYLFLDSLGDPDVIKTPGSVSNVRVQFGTGRDNTLMWVDAESIINKYLNELALEYYDNPPCSISDVDNWLKKLNQKDNTFVFQRHHANCVKWWSEKQHSIEEAKYSIKNNDESAKEQLSKITKKAFSTAYQKWDDVKDKLIDKLQLDKSHFTFHKDLSIIKKFGEDYKRSLDDFKDTLEFVKRAEMIYEKVIEAFEADMKEDIEIKKIEKGIQIDFDCPLDRDYAKLKSTFKSIAPSLYKLKFTADMAKAYKTTDNIKVEYLIQYPLENDCESSSGKYRSELYAPGNQKGTVTMCLQDMEKVSGLYKDFWSSEKRDCVSFWNKYFKETKSTVELILSTVIRDQDIKVEFMDTIMSLFPSRRNRERRLKRTWTQWFGDKILENLVWDTNFFLGGGNPTDGPMLKLAVGLDFPFLEFFDPRIEFLLQLRDFNEKKIPHDEKFKNCINKLTQLTPGDKEKLENFKLECASYWEKGGSWLVPPGFSAWSFGSYTLKDIQDLINGWTKWRNSKHLYLPTFFEIGFRLEYPIVYHNWENPLSFSHCGDGRCNPELGECKSCPTDCKSGDDVDSTTCAYYFMVCEDDEDCECGDGVCNVEMGECEFCKQDCQENADLKEKGKCMGGWNLVLNINPSDGHNAGWGSDIWYGNSNVGSIDKKYTNDYKDYSAWENPFKCLAIARHDGESMDGVKVWEMKAMKAFKDYFNSTNHNARDVVTQGGPVQLKHTVSAASRSTDPILASEGSNNNLAFNWRYHNNGARIVLTDKGHYSGQLSSINTNDDDCHGLGNELGANTKFGDGSEEWWHDASIIQGDCFGGGIVPCKVQGTDHGARLADGIKLGNYAIFISDKKGNKCIDFPFESPYKLV